MDRLPAFRYKVIMNIKDAVVVVTGGASGLGAAVVGRMVAAGALALILDRDADKGQALADSLGGKVRFLPTDVTRDEEVRAGLEQAASWGPVRAAVSCAGIGCVQRTIGRSGEPHPLDLYKNVIEVNLIGTFNLIRWAAARMSQNETDINGERGTIVCTASVAAYEGQTGQVAYAASKAGVVGMTLPVARDLSPTRIRINTIAPGLFDTPLLAGLPEAARESLSGTVVFPKRLGQVDEFASLALHLIENPYINGETIRIDGALRMQPK